MAKAKPLVDSADSYDELQDRYSKPERHSNGQFRQATVRPGTKGEHNFFNNISGTHGDDIKSTIRVQGPSRSEESLADFDPDVEHKPPAVKPERSGRR